MSVSLLCTAKEFASAELRRDREVAEVAVRIGTVAVGWTWDIYSRGEDLWHGLALLLRATEGPASSLEAC